LGANGGSDFVGDGRAPVALRILNSIKGQMYNLTLYDWSQRKLHFSPVKVQTI